MIIRALGIVLRFSSVGVDILNRITARLTPAHSGWSSVSLWPIGGTMAVGETMRAEASVVARRKI